MTRAQIWNRLYPVGTPVLVPRESEGVFGPFQTVTASEAKADGFDTCFVLVAGIVEPVNLDLVALDFGRAPNLRNLTIERADAEDAAREVEGQRANAARKAAILEATATLEALEAAAIAASGEADTAEQAAKQARAKAGMAAHTAKAQRVHIEGLR